MEGNAKCQEERLCRAPSLVHAAATTYILALAWNVATFNWALRVVFILSITKASFFLLLQRYANRLQRRRPDFF